MTKEQKIELINKIKSGEPNYKIDMWLCELGMKIKEAFDIRHKAENYINNKNVSNGAMNML